MFIIDALIVLGAIVFVLGLLGIWGVVRQGKHPGGGGSGMLGVAAFSLMFIVAGGAVGLLFAIIRLTI